MAILGADISLTGPGFAVLDSEDEALLITSIDLSHKNAVRGPERWDLIYLQFKQIIEEHVIDAVIFEGYAYSRFNVGPLAEIGGILRFYCYRRSIPFGAVPPNTLKKSFTNSGKADKTHMMKRAFELGFRCKNDNEADAVALARHGFLNPFKDLKNSWKPRGKQIKLSL